MNKEGCSMLLVTIAWTLIFFSSIHLNSGMIIPLEFNRDAQVSIVVFIIVFALNGKTSTIRD